MTGILKCRICGKEYEACRSVKRVAGVFHWQSVACCAEHGAEYLAQIRASRAETAVAEESASVSEAYALLDAEYETVKEELDNIKIKDEVSSSVCHYGLQQ